MIKGIGADLCQIIRMEDLVRDRAFLERYFDPGEQAYILARGVMAAASMAGHFAAKEAFAKAAGKGFYGIAPRDIVVCHDEGSAPYYRLGPSAQQAMAEKGAACSHLSISHEGGLALAFCVLEGD